MTTFFTSDLHIGHRLVSGIRGFWTEGTTMNDGEEMPRSSVPDVEAHTEALVASWKAAVRPDDIVWVLGDVCISARTWGVALELLSALPGRKRLISGNHDPVSSIHREAWKYQRDALGVFETVQDFAKVKLGTRTVLLSHYPYSGVGAEGIREGREQHQERYSEFRLPDRGFPLLHGHTHGPERLHFSQNGTPEVHIGLDAWGMKLVPQHEIEKLLDSVYVSAKVEESRA